MDTDILIPACVRGRMLGATLFSVSFACLAFVLGNVRGVTTVGPVLIHGQPALFVIAGLLGGPAAVLGALAGYTAAVSGLLPTAPVTMFGYAYLGLMAYVLRDHLWEQTTTTGGRLHKRLSGLVAVALVPTLGAAALTAWGYELLGQFHFFPYALLTVLSLTASTVLYAGPVIALLSLRKPEWVWSKSDDVGGSPSDSRRETVRVRSTHLLVLPLAWLVFGSMLSAGLQFGELLPTRMLRRNGWEFLHQVREFALQGVGVSTIQVSLGAFMLVLWVSTVHRRRLDT